MVWCITTERYLKCKKERVCAFFARHSIPMASHMLVKVLLEERAYCSQETLSLSSQIAPCKNGGYVYVLTKPERIMSIRLNAYIRSILKTKEKKITLCVPASLPASSALCALQKYFPAFHLFSHLALCFCSTPACAVSLQQAEESTQMHALPPVLHLQPISPFELSRAQEPTFSSTFYQLKSLNSSTAFSKKYTVSVYGHFLFAAKKGSSSSTGQSLEITHDLIAYKQVVGDRSFAIMEQNGARWSFFSKDKETIEALLRCIEQTPRHFPREVEEEAAADQTNGPCSASSSHSPAAFLFPREMPMIKEGLEQKSPAFLIRKLESHIQRSIWDNVNIEFIVYLLALQSFPLAAEVHQEIREFSAHRKRILSKLKSMESSL